MAEEKERVRYTFAHRIPVIIEVAISIAIVAVAYRHVADMDYRFPEVNSLERRMAFTCRCLVVSYVPVLLANFAVMAGRATTDAYNPFVGNEDLIQIRHKILQNSIEQFLLHSVTLFSFATVVDDAGLKFIPFLCLLFVAGRIFFVIGYNITQVLRGFGFSMTFLPTVCAFGYVLQTLYLKGFAKF